MAKPKGKKPPPKPQPAGQEAIAPHPKLYVGNLAGVGDGDFDDAKLRALFEACGEIASVDVVKNTANPFGFVEFATVAEAENAVEKMNGQSGLLVKFAKQTPALQFASRPTPAAAALAKQPEQDEETSDEGEEQEEVQEMLHAFAAFAPPARTAVVSARDLATPVESLQALVQKASKDGTSTKEQILYTFEEEDVEFGTTFVCTVELLAPGVKISHSGEARENKREAKKSAAQAALRDPAVYRLLPPLLVAKAREAKPAKEEATDSEDEASDESADSEAESEEKRDISGPVLSAKDKKKQLAAEQRAKKLAGRKAGKTAKIAEALKAALESSEEEEESEAEEEEQTSEEEEVGSEEEEEEDDSDDGKIDAAALAEKKAVIKVALLAAKKQRPGKRLVEKTNAAAAEAKENMDKKKHAEKAAFKDINLADKVKDTRKQENFGATKFIKP